MEVKVPTIRLSSGYGIPQLGLGTYQLAGSICTEAVRDAISLGYTHIDTAVGYGNHTEVGEGIRESGVPRDRLFITTKLPKNRLRRSQVIELGRKMLDELSMEYIDLLLIHWPNKKVPFQETLDAMKVLVKRRIVRSIGVSNFNSSIAAEASTISKLPIVTNQIELHPFLFQKELIDSCRALNMVITAYSPLAQGRVAQHDTIKCIAGKHGATPTQVSIAWLLAKGIVAIPKASSTNHLINNLEATNLTLGPDDHTSIDSIEETYRIIDGSWKDYDF